MPAWIAGCWLAAMPTPTVGRLCAPVRSHTLLSEFLRVHAMAAAKRYFQLR
jgi:hypothetical protein